MVHYNTNVFDTYKLHNLVKPHYLKQNNTVYFTELQERSIEVIYVYTKGFCLILALI
jgi:hypothetical protein